MLEAGVLCNDATISPPHPGHEQWHAVGDPTEAALVTVALKAGLVPQEIRSLRPRRAELPFDPAAKLMATLHGPAERGTVIIKGAPEAVLELCSGALTESSRAEVVKAAQAMADQSLRVLAVAEVPGAGLDGQSGFAQFRGATLLGLVGELDPPRPEVPPALEAARTAAGPLHRAFVNLAGGCGIDPLRPPGGRGGPSSDRQKPTGKAAGFGGGAARSRRVSAAIGPTPVSFGVVPSVAEFRWPAGTSRPGHSDRPSLGPGRLRPAPGLPCGRRRTEPSRPGWPRSVGR